ncbi:MAG: PRK06851 family protein [Bacillota bacterium]
MQLKGHIKRVFPGGNTSKGFYSFYQHIIPLDARRIFIIKGGPGVGKSSFMKHIAGEMAERGFDVELHHCSSDNGSIDGVVLPDLNIALIDGTAPHVMDPRLPGCVDEILHLGDYWNEKGMVANKKAILDCQREVSRLFASGYRFLKTASIVKKDMSVMYEEMSDPGYVNQQGARILSQLFEGMETASRPGKVRRLFASAITPDGPLNYLDTVLGTANKIYLLKGRPGTGKSGLLHKIECAAVEFGFAVEAFHCALDPARLDHLLIPDLSVAVTTPVEPCKLDLRHAEVVDLDFFDQGLYEKYAETIKTDEELFGALFGKAVSFLKQAKLTHDLMETYYVPNMDFSGIDQLKAKTLQRILAYAE